MTIRITKRRLGALLLAVALLAPSTAWATHVFVDVVDTKFYAAPAEWAKTNGITTGSPAGSDTFKPDDPVSRGESVTFLKRYHDNVAIPATNNLQSQIDDNDISLQSVSSIANTNKDAIDASQINAFDSATWLFPSVTTLGVLPVAVSVTIAAGHTGVIEIGFTAESACSGIDPSEWCKITLLIDGTPVGNDDFAFDSTNDGADGPGSWEGHAMTRVSADLTEGSYNITASSSVTDSSPGSGNGPPVFRLDEMVLTAKVHLTS